MRINISPQQIAAEIELYQAKLAIHKELLLAAQEKDLEERRFLTAAWKVLCFSAGAIPDNGAVEVCKAMKRWSEANEAIIRVQIKELESSIGIREAMLKEARRQETGLVLPER